MTLNRTLAPDFEIPEKITITEAERLSLPNNISCFTIHSPYQDVVRVEFIFDAGACFETKRLVAGATNDLCDDGTMHHSARAIAEHFDFFGSSLQAEHGSDKASITLYTLGKFLQDTLPMMMEIILEPAFPEEELKTYQTRNRQHLASSNKKVGFVARKLFAQNLFGPDHPYGYMVREEDYLNLQRQDLLDFQKKRYLEGSLSVVISGNLSERTQKILQEVIGNMGRHFVEKKIKGHATPDHSPSSLVYSERADALQSAIRVGRRLFNKKHPDFAGMSIVSTILGGYFGSRLMSNIREDKGYTYGIGSSLVSMQEDGYFFIATEVGVEVTNATLDEIYFEIRRLCEEPVGEEELKIVKNYLAGAFLRSIDGPFALADKWKGVYFYGLGYDYYSRYLETIRTITPDMIQKLCIKYLNKNELTEVVVGKK